MPVDEAQRARARAAIELIAADEGIKVLGWREVPVHTHTLSEISLGTMPHFEHLLIRARDGRVGMDLERLAFVLRRRAQHEAGVYFASLSSRTLVYKGMLTTHQLEEVFPELHDTDPVSYTHLRAHET